jgi:hypothetical protein
MKAPEVKKRLIAQHFVPIGSVDEHIATLRQSTSARFPSLLDQQGTTAKINPKDLEDWATVGVLASDPQERTSSVKKKYSLLKLTNLIDVHVNVLLFGQTHESWAHRLRKGMVIGIQKPKVLRPTEVKSHT